MSRIPPRVLDATGVPDGKVLVSSGEEYVPGDMSGAGGASAVGLYITTPEAHGAVGDGITDDTAAFRLAIAAIIAAGGGVLLCGARTYLLNGSQDTSQYGNAVLAIPAGTRAPVQIIGVAPANQCDPRTDAGYTILKTTKTGLSLDPTHGVPSLIGGPTDDAHWAENMLSVVNVCLWLPHNPTISGVDLIYTRRMLWDGSTVVAINVGDTDFVQPTSLYAFGLRTPDSLNYNTVLIRNGAASGMYVGLVGSVESVQVGYWSSKWCVLGWGTGTGGHAGQVDRMSLEWCKYHMGGWSQTAGVTALPNSHTGDTKAIVSVDNLDFEDAAGSPWYATVEHVHDPTNKLYGIVSYNRTVSGVGPATGLTVNGAASLVTSCLLAPTTGGVPTTRQVASGTGLTGGGDLSADRTLAIDLTTEAERIRDVIGAALVQGPGVTIAVNDAGDTITISASGGGAGELLMQDGVTGPPVPIETEARSDWLYQG